MADPDDLDATLVAQHLQLQAARKRVADLREAIGREGDARAAHLAPLDVPLPSAYGDLVAASRAYLEEVGRVDLALEDVLDAKELRLLRIEAQRLGWTASDAAAVGLCGLAGAVTAVLADAIDQPILDGLGIIARSELISRWKRETTNLPIDYHGPIVGGTAHRVTSAGHDIGRPVAAIRQIVEGVYHGTGWTFGEKVTRTALGTTGGTPFDAVPDLSIAAGLWVKHLITDVVTPTSLPVPGWTALYERASTEELGDFFKDMYWAGGEGPGWNLRTVGITKSIPLVVVEFGVRSKTGWDSWSDRGTLRLTDREHAKQDEMLLAGNGIVAAVTTGQALIECLTTQSPWACGRSTLKS